MRSASSVRFGCFRLDLANECLWRDGDSIALTPKAFAVLALLADHPDQLVTKNELLDRVWPNTFVSEAVLKVIISELRKVLGDDAREPRFIATAHRRGYRFVATVEADSSAPLATTPTPSSLRLVGRDDEMKRLNETYARACGGERQMVFITGEGGIGKSALVDAFEATLPSAGVQRVRGQCLEHHGSGEAYLPILEAVAQLCRGEQGPNVIELLRRHAPSWLAQLPWLLDEKDRVTAPGYIATNSRESMQREMADALEVYTTAQPLVLILEDLHWSDASTVDLLSRVAHRRAPARLLIVATFRPVDLILSQHPLKALKQRLDQQHLCTELRLPYLGAADVGRYIEVRLPGRAVPDGLVDTIVERTGGNALFVVNLVDDLLARGWLVADAQALRLSVPLERIHAEVPEGVRQMIDAQIDRLPAPHAAQFEAASVVGEEFSTAAVAAAVGQPLAEVERFCELLQQQSPYLHTLGVTTVDTGEVCGRYRFSHALYRDVFYQRIGGSRRVVLHRRIGDWLEAQHGSPAELARHFVAAVDSGCADKAVNYSRRAAERAVELFAYAEAAGHYQTALDVLASADAGASHREEACRLRIALGESLERNGTVALAGEAFTRAAELAREIDSSELFAKAALGRGRGHHPVSAVDPDLVALLEEALQRIGPQPGALRACLLARLDTALSPIPGAHERREPMAREALAYARQSDDPETLLLVLQYTRWAFNGRESPEELRESAERLGRLAAAVPNSEQALQFLLLRLTQLHELGDTATASANLTRLRESADAAGIVWFQWFAQRLVAYRALEEGRFADAERCMEEALTLGQRSDHPNVLPVYGAQRICLHLQRGWFAEIEPQLTAMSKRRPEQFTTRAALAYARAQLGDAAGARREFEALVADDFAHIPRDSLWLMVLARLTEVCVELRDAPRASTLHELFAPYAERVIGAGAGFASVGHGSRYLALLAHTCGRWDEAAAQFARAIEIHERMGAQPWLAQGLYEYGRLLREQPLKGTARAAARRRAATLLSRAHELAAQLDMRGLDAALRRLNA
ncbi:MAG: AAA family ATPase [Deltaproteobacteria bacterium]|nr:AAA family ATPase [Deltaproteobacteria bacterium]MBI3391114.1 AAA family ATPase [Deltaproteobacteria bacterium]